MKAIVLKANGGVENLVLAELPVPEVQTDEVLIQVKAIGINPVDTAVRQFSDVLMLRMKLQQFEKNIIIGWDVSGTVTGTGKNVSAWQGKDVFGMVNFPGQGKAYAGYIAAPADQLALKPANISHEEAAAATLAALTAWQALVTNAKVKKGEKVLIHAAAGGVGHYAVQIAKHLGAHVIGTASPANKDFLLSLGADEYIDYTTVKFEEIVRDADVVLDSVNRDHVLRSIEAAKKDGRIISIKGKLDDEIYARAKEQQKQVISVLVQSNGDDMKQIAALLEKGILKSHVAAVYSFEDMSKAHQQVETRKTRGKIVVRV